MKLSNAEAQLVVDLFVVGDMADRSEKEIREDPEKHLMSLVFAMIKEAKEEGSTTSFTLLDALMPENLAKAEELLRGQLIAQE